MERHSSENRLRGFRNAAGTAVLAVSLAACGSNGSTETQKPTVLPTESAIPTMTAVPSESPLTNPTPTIEVTPAPSASPTPEITPTPEASPTIDVIIKFVEGEHQSKTANAVTSSIEKAFKANPDLANIYAPAKTNTNICITGKIPGQIGTASTELLNKKIMCRITDANLYATYLKTGDKNVLIAAETLYDYAISSNGLGSGYQKELNAYLKQFGVLK